MKFGKILPLMVNPKTESEKRNYKAVTLNHELIATYKLHKKLSEAVEDGESDVANISNDLIIAKRALKEYENDIEQTKIQIALHRSRNELKDAIYNEDRLRSITSKHANIQANIKNNTERLESVKRALQINKDELSKVILPDLNLESYLKDLAVNVEKYKKAVKEFDKCLYDLIANLTNIMRIDDDKNYTELIWAHNQLFNYIEISDAFNPFQAKLERYVNYYLGKDDE